MTAVIFAALAVAAQLWLVSVLARRTLNSRTLLHRIRLRDMEGVRVLLADKSFALDSDIRRRGWLWLALATDDAEAWRHARGEG